MVHNSLRIAFGLFVAGLLAVVQTAAAAIVTNGDAIGDNYKIFAIDGGVTVDFTAHAPASANNGTIGKLTVTMDHPNLDFLGFKLLQNAAAAETLGPSAGLRLLLDVSDENGMIGTYWEDYHIRARDFSPIDPPPTNQGSHLAVAHFHDTTDTATFKFGSTPLVLQGNGDNVTQLNFGLGAPVNPGATFTASNILLHERSFQNVQRDFRVEFAPTVPEPTSLAIFLGLGAIAAYGARRKRII